MFSVIRQSYRLFFGQILVQAFLLCAVSLPSFSPALAEEKKDAGEKKEPLAADEGRAWATQGRLYVVIAADSKLEGVAGQIAEKNGNEISRLFRSNVAAGAYAVVRIPADSMTRQMFFSVLSSLRVTPQDAVVVYISGKGGYDRKNGAYYTLSKGKEELYRSEIRHALAKKNVRLRVLMTDNADGNAIPKKPEPKPEPKPEAKSDEKTNSTKFAGNNQELIIDVVIDDDDNNGKEPPAVPGDSKRGGAVKAEERKTTTPLFFSLFFNSKGTVDIQSALSGQYSLPADSGLGIFTETFAVLLKANANKCLSWYRFFPYLKEGNALMFKSIYPDGIDVRNGGSVQQTATPVLLTLGKGKTNGSDSEWAVVYPHGEQFDVKITDGKEEIKLSDSDSKTAANLIAETVKIVRPQNDAETGTHEDYAAIDPDNTVNGANGEPFGTKLPPVELPKDKPKSEKTDSGKTLPPALQGGKKPIFGVRAARFVSGGVQITEVISGSVAEEAGLKNGYIILKIDGKKIFNERDYENAVDEAGRSIELEYRDENGLQTKSIDLQK
ncbi:MAG: PDZ domain-containing protein [Planctomycetaceae bacterium]|nr:PDZ domain-containing protein [Planctomycetaceae bacterium]